jgi:hypothetical protein
MGIRHGEAWGTWILGMVRHGYVVARGDIEMHGEHGWGCKTSMERHGDAWKGLDRYGEAKR